MEESLPTPLSCWWEDKGTGFLVAIGPRCLCSCLLLAEDGVERLLTGPWLVATSNFKVSSEETSWR